MAFLRSGNHGFVRNLPGRAAAATPVSRMDTVRSMRVLCRNHRPAGGRRMPAYWVARSKINDPVEYKKYTDRLPAIFGRYGATIIARGGRYQLMEGPDKFRRFVVIEFPTFDQAVACFTSP